ncbi:hypothetical protein [Reichenbachiella sp.]|uniref:hypothetical protein n=1 Tax=Reichenbachiella sp. TaxID=2184521 RepID=UPI003B5AA04E
MSELIEFLQNLFDTSDWPPRWICGEWSNFHGWLYITSDFAIWLAYFIIPVIIIYFIQRRQDISFLPVFWLFGAFIIFCGATHILDALMFWWPAYRLSALIRFLTAIVSLITVFALIRDLPKILQVNLIDEEKEPNDVVAEYRSKIESLEKELLELKAKK